MADHGRKGAAILQSVGHELKRNPPKILAKTRRKKGSGAAARQRTAILLSKARKRGVECQVIADKSQEKQTYGRLPVLRRDGVSILIDGEHATANNKIMLIDDTTIITGSFNYTRKAEDENAENILIIKGYRRLFDKYLANYQHHKEHTRKYKTS